MKYFYNYQTAIGTLCIAEEDGEITDVGFGKSVGDPAEEKESELIEKAFIQLQEYLEGKRTTFSLPLNPSGTEFQRSVWNALCEITYGSTSTYKQVAEMVGNPKACRAVGLANNRNPIAVIIPCHRVIGTNGSLTGYAGGLDIKQKLLSLEQNNKL